MKTHNKQGQRSHIGYGSSYRRGSAGELGKGTEIGTVLGGQVWKVKPDKEAGSEHPCIWMQAGVAPFKNCNHYYDCMTCKYDVVMQKKAQQKKQPGWRDSMRKRRGLGRICRHSLNNRLPMRSCAYDYKCSNCDFDQFFEDTWSVRNSGRPIEIQRFKGFEFPMDYFFHDGHSWASLESGGYFRVGMDDFALKLLGQAEKFDLPLTGKELNHEKIGWGLTRDEKQAEVLSPVDGVIVEVNNRVRENPELVNQAPYEQGWLFMVRPPDIKKNARRLIEDTNTMNWMSEEITRLEKMIEEVAGPLAADGGHLADDIYGHLPDLGWKRLTKSFLRT
jgi:glycine cleavage system H lipoate-binding protein